jgi:hypothetical protein
MPEENEFSECPNPEVCKLMFHNINTELVKISGKVDLMSSKLFDSNGLSIVTQIAVLKSSMEALAETARSDRADRGKYTDMVAKTLIQVVVTAIMGASALLVLWERGMLTKP